ncbi:hypothetical protein DB346_09010 [Verrucomicrobia bacterium LW23]|nr:hypothetical protein DB346_09010 [Verrucomicrobia bacterium LW23]
MDCPLQLRQDILDYAVERTEAVVRRFLPGFRVPGFFAGYRTGPHDAAEVLHVLTLLRGMGMRTVCGEASDEVMLRLLRQIDGVRTETFYSYRVAEAMLCLGGLSALEQRGFSSQEIVNLRFATDSTHLYDPATRSLGGWSANYWAVLTRCEHNRMRLGLLPSADSQALYHEARTRTERMLRESELGFFDDCPNGSGRFDIYSADVYLFLEPIAQLFDNALMEHNIRAHVRLLETLALENGCLIAWGRSIGALSVCMTVELGALSLRNGMAADPARTLRLMRHAFNAFKANWLRDDLMASHRDGMTEGYRGVYRLLQMTLDCLAKLLAAAHLLEGAPPTVAASAPTPALDLFPHVDTLIAFETRRKAAVWMFRNRFLTFQLPLVAGFNADYVAWLHGPGVFENPVESPMICGVPRVATAQGEFFSADLPASYRKFPDGLEAVFETWHRSPARAISKSLGLKLAAAVAAGSAAPGDESGLKGTRRVRFTVEDDTICVCEHWTFDSAPGATAADAIEGISLDIPESTRPLVLEILPCPGCAADSAPTSGKPPELPGVTQSVVAVEGMPEWRSAWGGLRRLHQIHFQPARDIHFAWKLRPALRVAVAPADHDYLQALYGAMPAGAVELHDVPSHQAARHMSRPVRDMLGNADILHMGWPEHLIDPGTMPLPEFDARQLEFIRKVGESPVKVVWTMHNRRPHNPVWRGTRGDELYRAWAAVADAVIHHSNCGMELMRKELPYKPDAIHVVIPHGHYGAQMAVTQPRPALETLLGIPHAAPGQMRFGVLGRAQKEKQVDMIVRAFMRAARPDQLLLLTAHPYETDVTGDPRIVLLPRNGWFTREIIAAQVHACDALVSAHLHGESYLTSGTIADSIGAGIPMLANDWNFFVETLGDSALWHNNTEDGLTELFRTVSHEDLQRCKAATAALGPRFAWQALAPRTLKLLRRLGPLREAVQRG